MTNTGDDAPAKPAPDNQDPCDTAEFTPETSAEADQDSCEMTPEKGPEEKDSVVTLSAADYEKLRRAADERNDFFERLQRAVADFQNLQKRVKREQESFRKFAVQDFAKALLPAIDNLERALAAGETTQQTDGLIEGVRLILEQVRSSMQYFGITPIESVGLQFNPDCHEAVMQEETAEAAPLTVIRELERGYRLHERVLRPGKVVVAVLPRPKRQQSAKAGAQEVEEHIEEPPAD
ncbi:MAG TPA: nucleotide exchange factor GrpE [Candidatus Brocadiia bacterium]|nr:nucleotide exchange factor GrpE [Candidatus Brocadiia bacterium]